MLRKCWRANVIYLLVLSMADRAQFAADLSNGGRGISNMVETQLVNPLAQILAQADCRAGNTLVIQGTDPAAPDGLTYHIE